MMAATRPLPPEAAPLNVWVLLRRAFALVPLQLCCSFASEGSSPMGSVGKAQGWFAAST